LTELAERGELSHLLKKVSKLHLNAA